MPLISSWSYRAVLTWQLLIVGVLLRSNPTRSLSFPARISSTRLYRFRAYGGDGSDTRSQRIRPGRLRWGLRSRVEDSASEEPVGKKKTHPPDARRKRLKRKGGGNKSRKGKKIERWRVFGVEVHPDKLVGQQQGSGTDTLPIQKQVLHPSVLDALFQRLRVVDDNDGDKPTNHEWSLDALPAGVVDVNVVRRSLDARIHKRRSDDGTEGPRFVYVVDVDIRPSQLKLKKPLKNQPGRLERMAQTEASEQPKGSALNNADSDEEKPCHNVVIVGAGPAGLFCALQLARTGRVKPIVIERGQPVERRGKHIGALIHRRSLDSESNFAFGEGGAGTWSDGKLTTRIGRNSDAVRFVLETFVKYGAPSSILVDGSPHLGTDNLVKLLRNMRKNLREMGGEIRFGCKVTQLSIDKNGKATGVEYVDNASGTGSIERIDDADAVVLATGHSARDVYERLHQSDVQLEAKGFAVGFRVEHPQRIINKIQYGFEWGPTVVTGKKPTDAANQEYFQSLAAGMANQVFVKQHDGKLPVPSYRLATDQASDGSSRCRGVYSFCMCPGGQIVLSSTEKDEICVNGMSFSRRDSLWANSALVVTVSPDDEILEPYRKKYGVLAGVAFQRDMERRASVMGGGDLSVPVQRLTDFLAGRTSKTAPSSSYRLGVKPAACHEIYPPPLVESLRVAVTEHFEKRMPGFICDDALLHAVETRTSSPVRVSRDEETMEAVGAKRLFPAGEGAGFAGGIVSAAVDGMAVAEAVIDTLLGLDSISQEERRATRARVDTFY